jgi:hypothetical protein
LYGLFRHCKPARSPLINILQHESSLEDTTGVDTTGIETMGVEAMGVETTGIDLWTPHKTFPQRCPFRCPVFRMVSHIFVFIVSTTTDAETCSDTTCSETRTGVVGASSVGMFSVRDWCNLHCSFPHTSPFLFPDFNIVEQVIETTGAVTTGVDTTGVDTIFVTESAMCILQATFPQALPLRLPVLRIVSHVAIEKCLV